MHFTLFIFWLMLMLPGTAHKNSQQHPHQLLTTMDDYYKFPVCRPGSHLASPEMCELCAEGHTYTEHYNRDTSCQLCKLCGIKEVAVAACTITRNTRCHCARDFYRHASGDCISRQQNVLNPASGGVLRARGAFVRATPWSAWSTSDVAMTSGVASVTLTSSTDESRITPTAYFRATTEDLKSVSTLGTAVEIAKGGINQKITSNAVGPGSASEATHAGTTIVAHTLVTDRLEAAPTTDLIDSTNTLCTNGTCYVESTSAVISTTIRTDENIHGGIVHDDCRVVHVESDHCRPWKIATGVLIATVVLQMVIIVMLIISGAARRYVLRRNMTPSFSADSERSEWTPRSSQMSVPEPKQPSELYPSSEVVSM